MGLSCQKSMPDLTTVGTLINQINHSEIDHGFSNKLKTMNIILKIGWNDRHVYGFLKKTAQKVIYCSCKYFTFMKASSGSSSLSEF